ncbi:MAG: hypothetical protein ACXWUG_09130 [Polyangiales bacterium]
MVRTSALAFAVAAFALACDQPKVDPRGGGPAPVKSAMDACRRFEVAGFASQCKEEPVEPALTPGAKQRAIFLLPSGKRGQVLSFDDKSAYDKSAQSIEALPSAGRHRWGNPKARIYVQLNQDATEDEAERVKSVLDGL